MFIKHEFKVLAGGERELILYLDRYQQEFASEPGHTSETETDDEKNWLATAVVEYIKNKIPYLDKPFRVRVMTGTFLLGSMTFGAGTAQAAELTLSSAVKKQSSTTQRGSSRVGGTTCTYQVHAGDSLFLIAQRFHTTVDQLKATNHLTTDVIRVGQVLEVPCAPSRDGIGVQLNGRELPLDQPPVIQNNRTIVPIRTIAENLGATVGWDAQTDTVTITRGDTVIRLRLHENAANVNGQVVPLDSPAMLVNGHTMVPVRFVSEALGAQVGWDDDSQTVMISTNGQMPPTAAPTLPATPATATPPTPTPTPAPTPAPTAPTAPTAPAPVPVPDPEMQTTPVPPPPPAGTDRLDPGVQQSLQAIGYAADAAPTAAVRQFQLDYGLPATGIADDATQTAVQHAVVKKQIVADSTNYLGVPYHWGGATPAGFDCSGFIDYMFRTHGITDIPRTTSGSLFLKGTPVSSTDLRPGDLVFYGLNQKGVVSHVGIYMGNNQFISATSSKGIAVYPMNNPYWAPAYLGAKRVY